MTIEHSLPALPFILLLLSIALFPVRAPHFWESNRNKAIVTALFTIPVFLYLFVHDLSGLIHSLEEYVSFLVIMIGLFTTAGGIHVKGDLRGVPKANTVLLGIGAVLANFIGTTGASMLLVRPFLRANRERKFIRHLPVFFIFIVSNTGGLLTPIGDPPLFLGYLREVPFFWTLKLFPAWLLVNGLLLAIFYGMDSFYARKEMPHFPETGTHMRDPLRIEGKINFLFLFLVVAAVFLPFGWREGLMLAMAAASYFLASKAPRTANRFSFAPVVEVAVLFLGIFITMVPALSLLRMHGSVLGVTEPVEFFWLTGILSSLLDNAPTYLTFFSMAQGLDFSGTAVAGIAEPILKAISCGAVFMGANTYIGNGPNFMVKAIAEESGCPTPSFFGYMGYSLLILIPVFLVVTLVFFV